MQNGAEPPPAGRESVSSDDVKLARPGLTRMALHLGRCSLYVLQADAGERAEWGSAWEGSVVTTPLLAMAVADVRMRHACAGRGWRCRPRRHRGDHPTSHGRRRRSTGHSDGDHPVPPHQPIASIDGPTRDPPTIRLLPSPVPRRAPLGHRRRPKRRRVVSSAATAPTRVAAGNLLPGRQSVRCRLCHPRAESAERLDAADGGTKGRGGRGTPNLFTAAPDARGMTVAPRCGAGCTRAGSGGSGSGGGRRCKHHSKAYRRRARRPLQLLHRRPVDGGGEDSGGVHHQ